MSTVATHLSFEEFCDLYKDVLFSNGLSPHHLRALHNKLENEIYDAGDYFLLTQNEEQGLQAVVSAEDGINCSDPLSIFLIDHAWTFKQSDVRQKLCQTPGLLTRLGEMMGYSLHGECFSIDDDIVKNVARDLWKYSQTYSIGDQSNEQDNSLWYVLDEFGSHIQHSDEPTVMMVPFFYQPLQMAFSIMWPVADLDYGDELTRDYALHEKDSVIRKCRLLPWKAFDLTDLPCETKPYPDKFYEDAYKYSQATLPNLSNCRKPIKDKLKIHMNVLGHLITDTKRFQHVDSATEADILFCSDMKDFRTLSETHPEQMVSLFPCQNILTCKDFFSDVGRRAGQDGEVPNWIPLTFNLLRELPEFVSCFKRRAKTAKDRNVWIAKPWNLSRGVGIHVTDDLNALIRLREEKVPRVVCKYVENPVLFKRSDINASVKFDFSSTVVLTSIKPLKLFVCRNFFLRFSNKAFSLDDFDDYQKHFTVMNYFGEGKNLKDLKCADFKPMFDEQYPEHPWQTVENDVHKCFAELFRSATSRAPPYGLGEYSNSRAIFSIDAILAWKDDESVAGGKSMQPTLLECNLMPDFTRACKYYPDFLNNAFKLMFFDEPQEDFIDISDL